MISGFQNHLHVLYGLPGGWLDNADILDYGDAARKRRETLIEEQIASQMLQARQKQIVLPKIVDKVKLANVLQAKLGIRPLPGELHGNDRQKRIHVMILTLMMEDE